STRDAILISTSVLAENLRTGLTLLGDIAEHATFPDDEVAIAKQNASDKLSAAEADPDFLAQRALAKVVFGNYPYSRISPTQDSIAQTTPAELRAEYRRRFRPDQALLIIVGDLDQAHTVGLAASSFLPWAAPPVPGLAKLSAPDETVPHKLFIVPRPGSVQTALRVAAFGPTRRDPDYIPARLANAIYGGTFGSRLVTNIREDKGYTYSPGSNLQALQTAGVLVTRAEVRNEVTGASLNEVNYELNRIATTDVSADELKHAKQYLIGEEAIARQEKEAVARELASVWIDGLPADELARRDQQIQDAKVEDVNAAGRRYFPSSRMTFVAVGEDKVIRDQVAPLGLEVAPAP
ncbi:MAG: insulinase family protein, partial [Acidobacteriales bacterium]|nr:insulinase family protein [Terriglobales bacterium]